MVQTTKKKTTTRRRRKKKTTASQSEPPTTEVAVDPQSMDSPQLERAEAVADAVERSAAEAVAAAMDLDIPHPAAPSAGAPKRTRRGKRGGRGRRKSTEAADAPRAAEEPAAAPSRRTDRRPAAKKTTKPAAASGKSYDREMLINVAEGDECRIAVIHKGRLEELFVERGSSESHVGNIYKGIVANVEPSIQAAFIDFGVTRAGGKNGFLHISDLQPQYFPRGAGEPENVGKKTPRKDRPPIQRCLRRGQEIIVQVIKEGIGTKGPTLSTYLSLPGRYLVMMPGMSRVGVSRKIEDDEARRSMRDVLNQLELPGGMGFILRTAGMGRNKRDLQRDLNYLSRLWKTVAKQIKAAKAPALLYQESDLVIRTIRDVFGPEIDRIVIDDADTVDKANDFLSIANPRTKSVVDFYDKPTPLFHKFGIEHEIQQLHSRHVTLPSGGSIVIESTEALVAIDVNSGRYREHDNAENTALRINVEAAEEIARQLRLRDLGGLIVCDFIDMRLDRNCRAVERSLRDALKQHKERAKILRMSQFGIIEMTRQRRGPSIKRNAYQDCEYCQGTGLVKTPESVTFEVLRLTRSMTHRAEIGKIEVRVHPDVAHLLQNRYRSALFDVEQETGCHIVIAAVQSFGRDQIEFETRDDQGRLIVPDAHGPVGGR